MKRGFWIGAAAYAIWGLFPIYWKQLESVPGDAGHRPSHRVVVRGAAAGTGGVDVAGGASRGLVRRVCQQRHGRHLRDRRAADRRQLVYLRLGGESRLGRRDQPRLLHHAARQRAPRCRRPARGAAPLAVGRRGARDRRCRVADRRLWRRAVDRAGAGRVIRHLRAGEEESADGAAPWSHARDRSAVRACGRLSRAGRTARHGSVRTRRAGGRRCSWPAPASSPPCRC